MASNNYFLNLPTIQPINNPNNPKVIIGEINIIIRKNIVESDKKLNIIAGIMYIPNSIRAIVSSKEAAMT
jgi:hypothetical protein